MGKVLRLGFAMGGGVSLGTFSGSALTEVLKLVVLRGRDSNGDPFSEVVVDVFSGASAGAMLWPATLLRGAIAKIDRGDGRCKDEIYRGEGVMGADFHFHFPCTL